GVGGAVPELDARARAGVAGVRLADGVAPLLGRAVHAPAGAPAASRRVVGGAGEAVEGHAHEGGPRLEHVRVDGEHVLGHHAAGGAARGVDPVRVTLVGPLDIVDHRQDRDGVAAAVAALGRVRPGVETVAETGRLGGGWINDDKAILIRERGEFTALVEALTRAAAAVHRDHDR